MRTRKLAAMMIIMTAVSSFESMMVISLPLTLMMSGQSNSFTCVITSTRSTYLSSVLTIVVSTWMIGMSGTKTLSCYSTVEAEFEITIGSKPGAVTTPPEIILVVFVDAEEEPVVETAELTTAACTSRIGAPRSIYPVANCSVCLAWILASYF